MKLLKFEASWCGPCKMQTSVIKNLGKKVTIPITAIDIDEESSLDMIKYWNVRSVPTLILIDEEDVETAKELKRHNGFLKESEFLKFLEK